MFKYLFLFVGLVFFMPILGVLGGAFCGWMVALFGFEPTILNFLHSFGVNIDGLHLWEVGASLGFIGSFFRSSSSNSSKD